MTLAEIKTMLVSILSEDKIAYRMFPVNEAPELPYIIFNESTSNNFSSDNEVYVPVVEIIIEAYVDIEEGKDLGLEEDIEDALNGAGLVWSKDEDVIDSENMYLTTYTMEVIKDYGGSE